jgi:hypothetical protein
METIILRLPPDVLKFSIAVKFLPFIQVYALRLTCRKFATLLKDSVNIDKLIQDDLKHYVPDPRHFLDALKRHNLAQASHGIAGSFLLKNILGLPHDLWSCDLDIYGLEMDDGYPNRSHYTTFIHDAFKFKNRFFKKEEIQVELRGLEEYTYDELVDHLPLCLDSGLKISREEWARMPNPSLYFGHSGPTNEDKVGNIFYRDTLNEQLMKMRYSIAKYQGMGIANNSYFSGNADYDDDNDKSQVSKQFDYNIIKLRDSFCEEDKRWKQEHKYKRVQDYLDKHCDMAFTKVFYDGTRLYIRDLDSILLQRAEVDVNKLYNLLVIDIEDKFGGRNDYSDEIKQGDEVSEKEMCRENGNEMIRLFYYSLLVRQVKYLNRCFHVVLNLALESNPKEEEQDPIQNVRSMLSELFSYQPELEKSYSLSTFDKLCEESLIKNAFEKATQNKKRF